MQIDDFSIPEKPSKINDPCLQRVNEWERYLDSMEFVKVLKPKPPVDIQKHTQFVDSSNAPHHAQIISSCIPLVLNFFLTAIHPHINCHKKSFILGGHRTFQQIAFNGETEGQYSGSLLSLSGYTRSN